jgi:hypothetical protein
VTSDSADTAANSPYRGLVPYTEDDWRYFFGRDNEREVIITNLLASRLTLLYGASGVGKTSVLQAGVAHKLASLTGQNMQDSGSPGHAVVVFNSWRTDPVGDLLCQVKQALSQILGPSAQESLIDQRALADAFGAWTNASALDLLLVLDLFEEYFLYHPDEDGPESLARQLPLLIHRPDIRVNILISLREDTLARLDRFKGRIPSLFDNYLRMEQLAPEAARAAIEFPIEEYNRSDLNGGAAFSIEPALVNEVLRQAAVDDTDGQAGRGRIARSGTAERIDPSYLQVVMTRLWNEEIQANSRVLRLSTLEQLGSARQIELTYLDDALAALSSEQQDAAAAIFHYLVTPSGMKIAHTVHDLAEYGQVPEAAVGELVRLLAGDVRILRSVDPPGDFEEPRYEIYHDRLANAVLNWRVQHIANREHQAADERVAEAREEFDRRVARERALATRRTKRRIVIPAVLTLSFWFAFVVTLLSITLLPAWLRSDLRMTITLLAGALCGTLCWWVIVLVFRALSWTLVPRAKLLLAGVCVGASLLLFIPILSSADYYAPFYLPGVPLMVVAAAVSTLLVAVLVHRVEQPVPWRTSFAIAGWWLASALVSVIAGLILGSAAYNIAEPLREIGSYPVVIGSTVRIDYSSGETIRGVLAIAVSVVVGLGLQGYLGGRLMYRTLRQAAASSASPLAA